MDLQFEKSNLADRNTLEVLDQIFLDLELGFLFCGGAPSDALMSARPGPSGRVSRERYLYRDRTKNSALW
jgi:hypothetical protein